MNLLGDTKRWLPFNRLACGGCPYYLNKKCEGETEATSASFSTDDNDTSVIGCLNIKRQIQLFSNLHSLEPSKQIANHNSLNLPELIFGTNDGLKGFPAFNEDDYFAVSFRHLINEKGFFKYKSSSTLRNGLKIPQNSPLAFIATATDPRLEMFWYKSKSTDAWKRIADFDFKFTTSLSFSVYDEHPRFDQIFNRERNFITHDLLLAAGATSIPFIFFYNNKDFKQSVDWLNARPDISIVAIHAQQLNSQSQIYKLVQDMKLLQQNIQRNLHFVVIGVFSFLKCVSLKQAFSDLTVISSHPLHMASNGELLFSNLNSINISQNIPNTLLAVPNMNAYRSFYASI